MDPTDPVPVTIEGANAAPPDISTPTVADVPVEAPPNGGALEDGLPEATGYADAEAEARFLASLAAGGSPPAQVDSSGAPPAADAPVDAPPPAPEPPPASGADAKMEQMAAQMSELTNLVTTLVTGLQSVAASPSPALEPEKPTPKPWERPDISDFVTDLARDHLGQDAPPELISEYSQAYRLVQQWAPYQDHAEHGARAKQQIARARAEMARVGREVTRERELASLRERLNRQDKRPELEAQKAEMQRRYEQVVTPAKLRQAGYDVLADAADAGRFDPSVLLKGLTFDPTNPQRTLEQLTERTDAYMHAFSSLPASAPTPSPAPAAAAPTNEPPVPRLVNPGAIRIPTEQSGSVREPKYLSGAEADREFSRFWQSQRSSLGAKTPVPR